MTSSDCKIDKPRGRPVDPEKDEAILTAARELFGEKGYAASLDEIAERAGVVKQTVYSRFKSKEALFLACIRAGADDMLATLRTAPPGAHIRETLTAFAERYLDLILKPRSISLLRLLIGEAAAAKSVSRHFYADGLLYIHRQVASFVEQQARAGTLCVNDPDLAAGQFLGMLKGVEQLGALLGMSDADMGLERRRRIDASVEAFLKLYGADDRR